MNRREFLSAAGCTAVSASLLLPSHNLLANDDHPELIEVEGVGNSFSEALRNAFDLAYSTWINDPLGRRPVIVLPAGELEIDDIPNNNRGNYPFWMPPTFKLIGAGQGLTKLKCVQPTGSQYRLINTRLKTRSDVISACPSLNDECVNTAFSELGVCQNIEISGITFENFDNAICFSESESCVVKDCAFIGSLVAVQVFPDNMYGNKNTRFENCVFDGLRADGSKQRFGLRFETPFYANWFKTLYGVESKEACEALSVDFVNYDPDSLECQVVDEERVFDYLNQLFGTDHQSDVANTQCVVSGCEFTNITYSAIEFAGTLNTYNRVEYSTFSAISGTAIEFDKGASHNTAYRNQISNMTPTEVFAPSVPYVFQASIQEQEGSYVADRQLKAVVEAYGFAEPGHPNFKGEDIYKRAALLPEGNHIIENQFDVARSYMLEDYESSASVRRTLPDVYPSIKLSKPLNTKVIGNFEVVGDLSQFVYDNTVMGQSIVVYSDDTLRTERGGVTVDNNQMLGALFIISENDEQNSNLPFVVSNNTFGSSNVSARGGLLIDGLRASSLAITGNTVSCANNGSAASLKELDITNFSIIDNAFYLSSAYSFYLRSLDADVSQPRTLNFTGNTIEGGVAITLYDWTTSGADSEDVLVFNNNNLSKLSGASKVVAASLWFKHIEINDNTFDSIEDKVFQFYGLSDTISYANGNDLILADTSQSRAYSRNHKNTAGKYITADFWK